MTDGEGGAGSRGRAGASARAEYERRRTADEARRRATFGRWAPVVRFLTGPRASTESWRRGADGEERVGHWLDDAVGGCGEVLHDRAVPHRRSNIDHLAVVPSGIWVVDTKHYRGRLEHRDAGRWFAVRPRLFVGGRDKTALVTSALRQQALVARAAGGGPPVRAALCFVGVEVAPDARPFTVEGVLVTWPRALAVALRARGPLGPAQCSEWAARLAVAFPPYSP
jgi:Nuclease-related domain